jgi:hypothetical protein
MNVGRYRIYPGWLRRELSPTGVLTKAYGTGYKMTLVASDESIAAGCDPSEFWRRVNAALSLLWIRRWGFGLGAIPELFKHACKPVVYIHGIATWPSRWRRFSAACCASRSWSPCMAG